MTTDASWNWNDADWPKLLDAARSGIDEAVAEVFQRLNSYYWMIAAKDLPIDLRPKVGASDIVQKSMLEAVAHFPSFEGNTETEIRCWFTTIVNRNVIDAARHYRDAQRRSCKAEFPLAAGARSDEAVARLQPPSLAMRRAEEDTILLRAIATLPEQQRRAIELRYQDGLSHREIAATLGVSEVGARKICSRAIESLRKVLAR